MRNEADAAGNRPRPPLHLRICNRGGVIAILESRTARFLVTAAGLLATIGDFARRSGHLYLKRFQVSPLQIIPPSTQPFSDSSFADSSFMTPV